MQGQENRSNRWPHGLVDWNKWEGTPTGKKDLKKSKRPGVGPTYRKTGAAA